MFVFRLVLGTCAGRTTAERRAGHGDLVMLTGILVWSAFSRDPLAQRRTALVENANMIQKVVFPSEILAPYLTLSSLVNMCHRDPDRGRSSGLWFVLAGRDGGETSKINFAFQPRRTSRSACLPCPS